MVRRAKKNNTTVWVSIIIAFIMIMSIAGFFATDMSSPQIYNGHKFKVKQDGYYTSINGKEARFHVLPDQVASFQVSASAIARINATRMLLISFTPSGPETDLARFELNQELPTLFSIFVQQGIANQTTGYELPLIDCLNATASVPVLMLREAREPSISLEGDCIILSGDANSILNVKDRLFYSMAGIMNATG